MGLARHGVSNGYERRMPGTLATGVNKQKANQIVAQLMEEAGIDPGSVLGVQFFPEYMEVLRHKPGTVIEAGRVDTEIVKVMFV